MRALVALTLSTILAVACGGGAYTPIKVSPAVTSAPNAPASPASTGGYNYGY